MRKRLILLSLLLGIVLFPSVAITVKIGSSFPQGSSWDNSLRNLASQWKEITNGQVRMQIYPGGVTGSEADMIRKIRFSQLDAAVLGGFGINLIVPETFIFSLPGMLQTEEDVDYALKKFSPQFDEKFKKAGFYMLAWSKSGWANFFSKNAAVTPDLLRKEKLSISTTDESLGASFKKMKFTVVPTGVNELMIGLQSGMVSAFYGPPMLAAAFQWFSQAPHMTDFNMAPALGGIVISDRTWSRIPKKYHEDLQNVVFQVAREFSAESIKLNNKAMKVMKENGLSVEAVPENVRQEWIDLMKTGHTLFVGKGKKINTEFYETFQKSLQEERRKTALKLTP